MLGKSLAPKLCFYLLILDKFSSHRFGFPPRAPRPQATRGMPCRNGDSVTWTNTSYGSCWQRQPVEKASRAGACRGLRRNNEANATVRSSLADGGRATSTGTSDEWTTARLTAAESGQAKSTGAAGADGNHIGFDAISRLRESRAAASDFPRRQVAVAPIGSGRNSRATVDDFVCQGLPRPVPESRDWAAELPWTDTLGGE